MSMDRSNKQVMTMKGGEGQTSYAKNSSLQRMAILKARKFVEEAIHEMIKTTSFPNCFTMADLGCSSGPNTMLVVSEIIDIIFEISKQKGYEMPEFQFFLNDLPENDFNTIFKSYLQVLHEKLKTEIGDKLPIYSISATPASFYARLFPTNSLHFIHSSYSIHWLSQVPDGIENNKENISIGESSPPEVLKAYKEQFEKDFCMFLRLRSEELKASGHMVLTLLSKSNPDPTSKEYCYLHDLLAKSLLDLVTQGLIKKSSLNSFNLQLHTPSEEEVRMIIKNEGSFNLNGLEIFKIRWDQVSNNNNNYNINIDNIESSKNVANLMRAVMEPLIASHFEETTETTMDILFDRYANHVAHHISQDKSEWASIVMSLTNK